MTKFANLYFAAYDHDKNFICSGTLAELAKQLHKEKQSIRNYYHDTAQGKSSKIYVYHIPRLMKDELNRAKLLKNEYDKLKIKRFDLINELKSECEYMLDNKNKYRTCSNIENITNGLLAIELKITDLRSRLDYLKHHSEQAYLEYQEKGQ